MSNLIGLKLLRTLTCSFRMNDVGPWARVGEQHVVLVTPGLDHIQTVKAAISNLQVLASIRSERPVKPVTDLIVDGEHSICASTALGTAPAHAIATDVPLILTQQQDPRGVVAGFVHQRGLLILEDNQVDVYLAAHGPKYVLFAPVANYVLTLEPGLVSTSSLVARAELSWVRGKLYVWRLALRSFPLAPMPTCAWT